MSQGLSRSHEQLENLADEMRAKATVTIVAIIDSNIIKWQYVTV